MHNTRLSTRLTLNVQGRIKHKAPRAQGAAFCAMDSPTLRFPACFSPVILRPWMKVRPEKKPSLHPSLSLSLCLSVCLSVCLSIFHFQFSLPYNIHALHSVPVFISFNTCAVDAAYEVVLKRTFLAMSICIGCYFFTLVGMIIIYSKLGTNLQNHKEEKKSKGER